MSSVLRVHEKPSDQRQCPLCRDALEGDLHACRGCETSYHQACVAELGGCSTLGCRLRGELPDTITHWFCRACHHPIESDLTRRNCRCGAYLHDACVEAHGEACAQAAELQRSTSRPAPPPNRLSAGARREPSSWILMVVAVLAVLGTIVPILLALVANLRQASQLRGGSQRVAASPDSLDPWSVRELLEMMRTQGPEGPAGLELQRRGAHARYDLLDALNWANPDYPRVMDAIERALGRPAADVILEACLDPDPLVRAAAVGALPCIQDLERARAAARNALDDPDPQVREEAQLAADYLRISLDLKALGED